MSPFGTIRPDIVDRAGAGSTRSIQLEPLAAFQDTRLRSCRSASGYALYNLAPVSAAKANLRLWQTPAGQVPCPSFTIDGRVPVQVKRQYGSLDMHKRSLGAGGPQVGAVGLGCMSFRGIYGSTNEAESHRVLSLAPHLGIEHLDVENIYGDCLLEEVIGSFIKQRPGQFVVATKAGISSDYSAAGRSLCRDRSNSLGWLCSWRPLLRRASGWS
jgi:hypothetical protein